MSFSEPFNLLFLRQSPRYLICGMLLGSLYAAAHQHAAAGTMSALAATCGLVWAYRRSKQGPPVTAESTIEASQLHLQDKLTGIANREVFESKLQDEARRERRAGEPTAILLLDVDAFEELREGGRELDADVALLTLARSLTRMLPRRTDLLARFDKSTFVVMLPGTDLPGALRVAARLRWAVLRLSITHPGAPSGLVTASIGMAVQHGLLSEGGQALLTAAQVALCKARRSAPDRLEYVLLEGEDPGEQPTVAINARPSIRAWIPEQDRMQPSL